MSFASRLTKPAAAALAALLAMSPAAFAKDPSQKTIDNCRGDYNKFCPSYSVGTPELSDCMTKAGQRKALSPKCLQSLIDDGWCRASI